MDTEECVKGVEAYYNAMEFIGPWFGFDLACMGTNWCAMATFTMCMYIPLL